MITTNRHKGFLHNPVYLPDLETEYVDGKRYYKTPAGNLPSVTTVLGQKLKNPGLEAWNCLLYTSDAADE